MMKTKIDFNSKQTLLLGNCLVGVSGFCEEETKKKIIEVVEYLITREGKPYTYFDIDQIEIAWKCIKSCFDDKIVLYNEQEKMDLSIMMMGLAKILDKPEETKWKEFI